MQRSHSRGFTLVEMLVIIVLVLFLAALLMPCGCPSPPAAREACCLSNLKQIGAAVAMYTQDYDGVLPWNPAPGGLPAASWAPAFRPADCAAQPTTSFVTMLAPYVRNVEVFRCPAYPGHDAARHLAYARSLAHSLRSGIGYGFNELLIGSPCRPRSLTSLWGDPKGFALLADAEQPWASTTDHWLKVSGEWAPYWAWNPATPPRHQGYGEHAGQNFAFADGHARFLRPARLGGTAARDGYYPGARLE